MPVFEEPKGPLFSPASFFLHIYAVMLYPRQRNANDRRSWYAAAMAREYEVCRRIGAPPKILSDFHVWIPDLWELKQSPARVYEDGRERTARARQSGYMLLYLTSLALHTPRHCKVERVKTLLASEFSGRGVSESLLEKVWPEFQTVSHLWASLVVREKEPDGALEWIAFMKTAEAFRRAAEDARILGSAKTWRPEVASLYRGEEYIPPLTPDQIAFLDDQFPA